MVRLARPRLRRAGELKVFSFLRFFSRAGTEALGLHTRTRSDALLCAPLDTHVSSLTYTPNPTHTQPHQIASTAHIPAGSKTAVVVGGSAGPGPERPRSRLHLEHWGRLKAAGWTVYG